MRGSGSRGSTTESALARIVANAVTARAASSVVRGASLGPRHVQNTLKGVVQRPEARWPLFCERKDVLRGAGPVGAVLPLEQAEARAVERAALLWVAAWQVELVIGSPVHRRQLGLRLHIEPLLEGSTSRCSRCCPSRSSPSGRTA